MVQEEALFLRVFDSPVGGSRAVDFNIPLTTYILFHSVFIFSQTSTQDLHKPDMYISAWLDIMKSTGPSYAQSVKVSCLASP